MERFLQRIDNYWRLGKYIVIISGVIISIYIQVQTWNELKLISKKNQEEIKFLREMVNAGFLYDLKKQDEKLRANIEDLKISDIERDILRCSIVKKYNLSYTDEVETFCNRIKSIDFSKLKNKDNERR